MSPSLWPLAQEAMDLLMDHGPTPENLERAQYLFEKVIAEAEPGSDELIASFYGIASVHSIRGDTRKALPNLLAYGKMLIDGGAVFE